MDAQQIIDSAKPSIARAYAEALYKKTLQKRQKKIFVRRIDGIWEIHSK